MTVAVSGVDRGAPLVVGLTGSIASGKTMVAEILRERGAEVIDADQVYHSLLKPESPLLQAIVDRFGPAMRNENGELNRAALASIVFSDPAALADLDRITHPAVVAGVQRQVAQSSARYVVIEAVKLVQSGLSADVDSLWYIAADQDTRIRRLMKRNGFSWEVASKRVLAGSDQIPTNIQPDVILDTSGPLDTTRNAVDAAWNTLLESHSREHRLKA